MFPSQLSTFVGDLFSYFISFFSRIWRKKRSKQKCLVCHLEQKHYNFIPSFYFPVYKPEEISIICAAASFILFQPCSKRHWFLRPGDTLRSHENCPFSKEESIVVLNPPKERIPLVLIWPKNSFGISEKPEQTFWPSQYLCKYFLTTFNDRTFFSLMCPLNLLWYILISCLLFFFPLFIHFSRNISCRTWRLLFNSSSVFSRFNYLRFLICLHWSYFTTF